MLHCRSISLRDVDFPLTAEAIGAEVPGREVYHLTDVLVLRNGEDHAVVRVATEGRGVLRPVRDVEVVSLPDGTVAVEAPDVDVFNPSHLAEVADGHGGRTVVVHGRYGYVGVALPTDPLRVRVVDLVPPDEPRLLAMAQALLDADPPDAPLVLVPDLVDAEQEAREALGDGRGSDDAVLYPCEGSCAGPLFLDRGPDLDADEAGRALVVGCEQSARIFRTLYGVRGQLVDVCPLGRAVAAGDADGEEVPEDVRTPACLTRCCLVSDVEEKGDVVCVPWGASHAQVRRALRVLAARADGEREAGRGGAEGGDGQRGARQG